MTFGIMFPPLCVALVVNIVATVYLFRVNVGNWISSIVENDKQHMVDILQQESNIADLMKLFNFSVWVLVTVCCWFYTLFLFDTLGDAVGFENAYWVLIVMPLMPLVIYGLYLVVYKYCINANACCSGNNSCADCNFEQSTGVEMQSIDTVHNALVVRHDC